MSAPLPKRPQLKPIIFRCDRCGADDDSKCGCPDFWEREETIQAGKDMRDAAAEETKR